MGKFTKAAKLHLLGRPLRNAEASSQRYGVLWGLPVLSSDAISSVAYACEEILIILVPVLGMASYGPMMGAAGVIIGLLLILILCYRQVIDAYPRGGGAYSVAKGNLGTAPSLVAASGLVIDYVLTVAVSVCSGVAAIISAFPQSEPWRIPMAVFFIALITIGNLRGLKESSVAFGLPAYAFMTAIIAMILAGLVRAVLGQVPPANTQAMAVATGDLTLFLFLHAFSSGCSALTGVEAISNSVSNFSSPSQAHAKRTLTMLGLIVFVIFGGVCLLAMVYHAVPGQEMTVVAQIAAGVFGGSSAMFYVVQVTTAVILFLAANTAYNGLPQLMSLLAEDSYLPKRFDDKGTRLVYSNGIIFVAIFATLLVVLFQGQTHLLIPLYAAGVFISFTIAQGGMVVHWRKMQGRGWRRRAFINGLGTAITTLVFVIIVITRFVAGAWIAIAGIALCSMAMWAMSRHYALVKENLALTDARQARACIEKPVAPTRILIPVRDIDKSFIKTLNYAQALSDDIEVYHVKTSALSTRKLKAEYRRLDLPYPLVIEAANMRSVNGAVVAHVDKMIGGLEDGQVLTVVIPQLVTEWYQAGLHNQTTLLIESALLARRDVALSTVPYIIEAKQTDRRPIADNRI